MPCNAIAVVALAIEIAQVEELRNSADALSTFEQFLKETLRCDIKTSVMGKQPNHTVMFYVSRGRYIQLSQRGLELYGTFSAAERTSIETFVQELCRALTEQQLVNAITSQFELVDDQPVLDDYQAQIGRVLTVRV